MCQQFVLSLFFLIDSVIQLLFRILETVLKANNIPPAVCSLVQGGADIG